MKNTSYCLKDIMTANPVTITPDKTAMDVSEVFNNSDFHHIPVVSSKGEVVGIISKTDLDQHSIGMSLFANANRQDYTDALFQTLLVQSFMTKAPQVLAPGDSIKDAYHLFKKHNFRAIPIVEEGTLVGIVTPIDMVKPFLN